jgi:hypothetical protein
LAGKHTRELLEYPEKEEKSMQPEQTVSEMALEVLERQAKALAELSGRPLEEALVKVLKTEPGGLLSELAEGPHRSEKARRWQANLLKERIEQRLPQGLPG